MNKANTLRASIALVAGVAAGAVPVAMGCGSNTAAQDAGTVAPFEQLIDPNQCGNCHAQHLADWLASAHAHASDDPVFLAMNQRGQRETEGGLGDFCVKCHAPMAVRFGQKTDPASLASLPEQFRGVTCFFCHSIDSVDKAHPFNANVTISDSGVMRGGLTDPVANPFHHSTYSALQDGLTLESSNMCGVCHDIKNQQDADIERTFSEYHASPYNAGAGHGGNTCGGCHMRPPSSRVVGTGGPVRSNGFHPHNFPAVDVPPAADPSAGRAAVQAALDALAIRGALCVSRNGGIRVVLDPIGVGHAWPSGAAQDRRVWAEVIAYKNNQVIYSSGVVPDGTAVGTEKETSPDDLWLLHDQMFDSQCNKVDMFWQAAKTSGNELPPASTFNQSLQAFYLSHIERDFPRDGTPLAAPQSVGVKPDRVTLRIRIQAIGLDVINNLVDSGDLDAGAPGAISAPFDVSLVGLGGPRMLEWTEAAAAAAADAGGPFGFEEKVDTMGLTTCVGLAGFNLQTTVPAPPDPTCPP